MVTKGEKFTAKFLSIMSTATASEMIIAGPRGEEVTKSQTIS